MKLKHVFIAVEWHDTHQSHQINKFQNLKATMMNRSYSDCEDSQMTNRNVWSFGNYG